VLLSEGYDPIRKFQFYIPVGGGVEFRERLQDAAARELFEELGLKDQTLEFLNFQIKIKVPGTKNRFGATRFGMCLGVCISTVGQADVGTRTSDPIGDIATNRGVSVCHGPACPAVPNGYRKPDYG